MRSGFKIIAEDGKVDIRYIIDNCDLSLSNLDGNIKEIEIYNDTDLDKDVRRIRGNIKLNNGTIKYFAQTTV